MKHVLVLFALGVAATAARADGDVEAGKAKIKPLQCQSCHGRQGIAKMPGVPNLAGRPQDFLAAALRAYRSGERKNEAMNAVAAKLTDGDVADLAAYYASVQVAGAPASP